VTSYCSIVWLVRDITVQWETFAEKTFANWWKIRWKLSQIGEKLFANWRKRGENFGGLLAGATKRCHAPKFCEKKKKNFRKWPQNLKNLRKFFFLKSTPLYGTFPKIWTNGIINATHGCRNLSVEFIWLSHAWLSHACDIAETQRHMTLQTVGQWVSCYCVVMGVIRKRLNRTLVAY